MAGFIDVLKGVFIPALIAAILYLALAYVIIPLVRKHRNRYNQYLPINIASDRTSSLRERIADTLTAVFLPSFRRQRVVDGSARRPGSGSGDELTFGEEEGESMVGFDMNRRERLATHSNVGMDSERRLSRDLEQGFKDESDDESSDDRRS